MTSQRGLTIAAPNQRFVKVAGALVVSVGCLVLVGWILDIAILKSFLPGLVTMKTNTALGFVLAGTSLLFVVQKPTNFKLRLVARLCSLVVLALSMSTFGEYLFGWNHSHGFLGLKSSHGSESQR